MTQPAERQSALSRYLNLVQPTLVQRRDVINANDKQASNVRRLARHYDQMINTHKAAQTRGIGRPTAQVRQQVPANELLQPPVRKKRSLRRASKVIVSSALPLRRAASEPCLTVTRQAHATPLKQVNFDVWRQSSDMLDVTSCSVSPASLASPCESLEEIPLLLRSIPFEYFNRKCSRSNSSDSAVVMDDFSPSATPSHSPNPHPTRSGRADRRDRILLTDNDDVIKHRPDEPDVLLRHTPGRYLKPPSVVISDHTGATYVALPAVGSGRDNSLLASFLGRSHSIDYTICPRKVSDCSTCSSVSTVDMSALPNYETLNVDVDWAKRDSDCSSCLTASDDDVDVLITQPSPPKHKKSSNWRKVRNVVQWTPFIQTYKRHKYPWVQLAGHQGNFKAGYRQGTILKKLCPAEKCALEALKTDELHPYVPEYLGLVESSESEKYLQLQDLLGDFSNPCVMDIKMGVRTYLEEELAKARHKPKLRKDMYEKMIQIDKAAPTEAEHRAKAVTKPRYMVWRETISSTATLGFRIEGVRRADGTSTKDFKTTRTREQVLSALAGFVEGYPHALPIYVERLKLIEDTLENSEFFKSHELIGSSLLFVHNEEKAGVWLIDFAKTVPLPKNVAITHSTPWVEGTHEDGYLIGFNNLVELVDIATAEQETTNKITAEVNLQPPGPEVNPPVVSSPEANPPAVFNEQPKPTEHNGHHVNHSIPSIPVECVSIPCAEQA